MGAVAVHNNPGSMSSVTFWEPERANPVHDSVLAEVAASRAARKLDHGLGTRVHYRKLDELELPLQEWEGVTTAPTAESSQVPDWMVSRMHLGSAALQRAILVSARVVAAGCDRVGAGVSAVMPERSLPQLPWGEAERMQQGLEAVR